MTEAQDTPKELDYFLSEKKWFMVVSLIGKLTETSAALLDGCQAEILQKKARYVVLSLHDVDEVTPAAIPALIKLHTAIRDLPADLRLCRIRPDIRRMLLESKAIRSDEWAANLKEALQSFGNPQTE